MPPEVAVTETLKQEGKTMAITLTEAAAAHVRKSLAKRGKGEVCASVCVLPAVPARPMCSSSSMSSSRMRMVFESHGVKLIVDPKSLLFLDGTELDYTREGLNEGFKFDNPNVKDACGCGESFTV